MGMRCCYVKHEMESMNLLEWLVINVGMEFVCVRTLYLVGVV